MTHTTDLDLSTKQISELTSPDALCAWLAKLGYDTAARTQLTPESIGLAGESANAFKKIELLAEDGEQFLRVVFAQPKSLTAKARNDLARVLGKSNIDHLLILAADFDTLEFVLLDKRKREKKGPVGVEGVQVVPLKFDVPRRAVDGRQLRTLRRFTWTARDGLEQYDKLKSVFEAASFSEEYFCDRALFADHFLLTRLREDPAWRESPTAAFHAVKPLLAEFRTRWLDKETAIVRKEFFEPIFQLLGFAVHEIREASQDRIRADYSLSGGKGTAAALVYPWDRWLDGPDFNLGANKRDRSKCQRAAAGDKVSAGRELRVARGGWRSPS